jgi:hypothetical protein
MTKLKGLIIYQLFREEQIENEFVTPLRFIMKSHHVEDDASLGGLRVYLLLKTMEKVLHWKQSLDVQNVWIGKQIPAILMDGFKSLLHIRQFHAQILKDPHL